MKKIGVSRRCAATKEWASKIYERDGYRCQNCGSQEKLNAHHILKWKDRPDLRWSIENGITYCSPCHHTLEKQGSIPWNKGQKTPEDVKKKQSVARLGKDPWNKGKKSELPAYRECKMCKIRKKIFEFTPLERGKFYTHICKMCRNARIRNHGLMNGNE